MAFDALVRYEDEGKSYYGNLVEITEAGFKVTKLSGNLTEGFASSGEYSIAVPKLLCPLEKTPIIQCVSVNSGKHATEAKLTVPKYPVIFTKPADALAGPMDDIPIHFNAQVMLDYEGELTVVIGRDALNISELEALDYVLGYTAGNDISACNFQMQDASGGQYTYAKSFNAFTPVGPAI